MTIFILLLKNNRDFLYADSLLLEMNNKSLKNQKPYEPTWAKP